MSTINALQLQTLLVDSILHYKSGMHLTRHYIVGKRTFCNAIGISTRTPSKKMIEHIGYIYMQNGMEQKFIDTCNRFELKVNF